MTSELKAYLFAGLAIIVAILISLAAWWGYRFGVSTEHARGEAQLSALKQTYADENAKAQAELRKRLEEATARGDELSSKLLTTEATTTRQSQEKTRAVTKITTGRRCLDADVVRMLNSDQPITQSSAGHNSGNVPQAAGSAAATDGAAATDTDVAQWIANARASYDICRNRLDALIDFAAGKSDDHDKTDANAAMETSQ